MYPPPINSSSTCSAAAASFKFGTVFRPKFIRRPFRVLLAAALTVCLPAFAVEDEIAAQQRAAAAAGAPKQMTRGAKMDYGPVLCTSVAMPGNTPDCVIVLKGVTVRLSPEAAVCFDTDTLRMAVGWTGGFFDLKETNIGNYKGDHLGAAAIAGKVEFRTENAPGWSLSDNFADPRPAKNGPLPRALATYGGFHRQGERIVFEYRVGDCDISESPAPWASGEKHFFGREFSVGKSAAALHLLLPNAPVQARVEGADFRPQTAGGHSFLTIPPHAQPLRFTVLLGAGPFGADIAPVPLPKITTNASPGAPAWPAITLAGSRAADASGYVVDTIPVPEDNPWKSWMRLTGIDFFADGRAAVCTLNGDVWIVSGLDADLQHVTWKRFASGLFEPLGLKIVKEQVYVLCRDQIMRLTDTNRDGEANFYECFNHDRALYPSYHAFAFDLQTDAAGNFYYVVGGNQLGTKRDWHASVFKVSADGLKTETVATGFRAPNGMAVGPHGEIAVGDNQGHWIPSSKINLVKAGGFYGHVADPRIDPKAVAPPSYDQPLCWIPMSMDNSSGGQIWGSGDKWGPFSHSLLHTSYGQSALFAILEQKVGEVTQGGAVKFPLKFASGIMRGRFNPGDGQLYVAGLKGWQTNAGRDGCFQRIRYTGKPVLMPTGLRVNKDRLAITYPVALDKAAAADAQNYSISQWNYQWHSTYGSPDVSVADPKKTGRDPVEVTSAQLSEDGHTITLQVPGLQPVMQMLIKLNLKSAEGAAFTTELANTIHVIPSS